MPVLALQSAELIQAVGQFVQGLPGGFWGFIAFLVFLIVVMPYVVLFVHSWKSSTAIGTGLSKLADAVGSLKDTQGSHHNENTEKLTRIEDGVDNAHQKLDVVLNKQETHGQLLQRIDARGRN